MHILLVLFLCILGSGHRIESDSYEWIVMNKKILGKYYVFSTYTFLHLLLLHIFGEKYLSLTLRIIKLLGRLDE